MYGPPINLVQDAAERVRLTAEILDVFGGETAAPATEALAVRFTRFQYVQDGEPWHVTVGALAPEGVDQVELVNRPYGTTTWRSLPRLVGPREGG